MAPTETDQPERVVKPLAGILQDIDRGRPHTEASMAFADAFEAVHNQGGKATVTITLTIEPAAKHNLDQLAVSAAVVSKIPRDKPKPSVWFFGRDGQPTRDDPAQPQLDLRIAEPVKARVAGEGR